MKTRLPLAILIASLCTSSRAEPQALVLHYSFDDGTASDAGESGNEGTVHGGEFVESPKGRALRLDGSSTFIECPMSDSLRTLEREGSLEMWIKPTALQGGLVNISKGTEQSDQRLVLGFNTTGEQPEFSLTISDGTGMKKHAREEGLNLPAKDQWNHVVITFGANTVAMYLDGRLMKIMSAPRGMPLLEELPLWIGRSQGKGKEFFQGQIDEVRIYNRAIPSEQVVVNYKADAATFGKDPSVFKKPNVAIMVLPEPGWITAELDVGLLRPLPEGSTIRARLVDEKGKHLEVGSSKKLFASALVSFIKLDASRLPPGNYKIRTGINGPDGQALSETMEQPVTWPGRDKAFEGITIRNNLVWDLLDAKPGRIQGKKSYAFYSPKARWLWFEAKVEAGGGEVHISVDPPGRRPAELAFEPGENSTKHSVCFLPAGEARLIVQAGGTSHIDHLVARSIPELYHHKLLGGPKPTAVSPEVVGFMKKHILGNINTWVGPIHDEVIQQYAPKNYRVLSGLHAKGTRDIGEPYFASMEEAYEYITNHKSIHEERADGIIFDEFTGTSVQCSYYAEAFRKIKAEDRFKDKLIYAYIATLHGDEHGRNFVQAILDAGGALVWERYLATRSSETTAREYLRQMMAEEAVKYRERCPGSIERLIPLFAYFTMAGAHLNNATPAVNYLTYLDMQFNIVANHPAFWGTYGLGGWGSSYADEETTRWFMHLLRHYGMEGQTEPASRDPYIGGYIDNPDFMYGTEGWTLHPAGDGSIYPAVQRGLGNFQGRKIRTEGGSVLVTKRSEKGPNRFSQEIKNLEPGRLYSLQMFTGDHESLSRVETHGVSIKIENATMLRDKSYMYLVCNPPWGRYPPYTTNEKLAWMNYHYRVFRANGTTAKLEISDWGNDAAFHAKDLIGTNIPIGPIGQELMYNFIAIKPYYAGDDH